MHALGNICDENSSSGEVPVCRGEWSLTVLLGYQGGAPEFSYPTIFTPASKAAAHKSESKSGSVSFWVSQIWIRDYLYGSGSFHQQAKKCRKHLISTVL